MSENPKAPTGPAISILLVDDHEVVREGVARVLGRRYNNCSLGHASTYERAVEMIHDGNWSLVITDISINGRGGIDIIQEVNSYRKDLPVLVFTMHEEQDYGIRAIKNGAAGYVCKAAGVKTLVEAVDQVLQGRRFVSPDLAQSLVSWVRKDSDGPPHGKLSDREFQVLCRIGRGVAIKEIGAELNLSVKTVSTYRSRVLEKLGLKSLADIVKYCIEHRLTT